ncbi:hypothetical protein L228DRAFT_248700 [Xylona heveae TC161]|uniref:J domain-containing protein n=1 Tax=Xylona heveae (strain CBS 132557 / TC161) TaxID=1328760 RepID=A0A165G9Z5_XYLHT|nr:hypothetical protein L228DRAFT_248700 [Xylona heveae TC161]KZF21927.1 hypothetical protein L228DRAFT_248700 [Xylona heveae TC161]
MLIRKPALLFSSSGGYLCFCVTPHQIHTSSTITSQQCIRFSQLEDRRRPQVSRRYATVNSEEINGFRDEDRRHWPRVANPLTPPTPYQIFGLKKGAPYSKRRFYELVKIYHPDLNGQNHHSPCHYLSHAVRLERYRLIVAANDLLSDPVKRSAYDRYGAGWNGQPEARGTTNGGTQSGYSSWREGNNPSQNATWEDWERWYQREAGGPQEPQFFSNSVFLSLVVILAALGGIGQATRAGNYANTFIEQRDHVHGEALKELSRARQGLTNPGNNRQERIQSFLRLRDPVANGSTDPHEEGYRRLLPEPEVCHSADIKGRKTNS